MHIQAASREDSALKAEGVSGSNHPAVHVAAGHNLNLDITPDQSSSAAELTEVLTREEAQGQHPVVHAQSPEHEVQSSISRPLQTEFIERRRDAPRVLGLQPSRYFNFLDIFIVFFVIVNRILTT